jgi:hypothetical protein
MSVALRGLCCRLASSAERRAAGFNITGESQAFDRQLAGNSLPPASLRDAATGELLTLLLLVLRRLPRRADQISAALAGGRFTTNLRLFSDRRDVQVVATLVNRAVLALIGAALGGMSVIILLAHGSPAVARGVSLLQLFGCIGLFLSVTLLLRGRPPSPPPTPAMTGRTGPGSPWPATDGCRQAWPNLIKGLRRAFTRV